MSYLVKSAPRTSSYTRIAAPGRGDLCRVGARRAEVLATGDREGVLCLLTGADTLTVDGLPKPVHIGPRCDVFTDPPAAIYLPPHSSARLTAEQGGCFALVFAPSGSGAPVAVVGPDDIERRNAGAANWARSVYNVIDATRARSALSLGRRSTRRGTSRAILRTNTTSARWPGRSSGSRTKGRLCRCRIVGFRSKALR